MIKFKDLSHKIISDVYYIPTLRSNILSMVSLLKVNGGKILMEGQKLWLCDGESNLIAIVFMTTDRMFSIDLQTVGPMCLKTCVEDPSRRWHMRFGHLNFEGLKEMGRKDMVRGLPCIYNPNQLCEAFLHGKHPKKPFPKQSISS